MKAIPLTQGKVALVDDEDYEVLSAHKWFAHRGGRGYYALRNIRRPDGERTVECMHRVVLSRKLGRTLLRSEEVDHEHGDGLDNRRGKIRLATSAQNKRNCRRHSSNPSSRFLGVCWYKSHQKWVARINVYGKTIPLGYYADERQAMLAREAYISAHPELMARSNLQQSERTE